MVSDVVKYTVITTRSSTKTVQFDQRIVEVKMGDESRNGLPGFNPDSEDCCAQDWQNYKRDFLVHLDARGLHDKPGRRTVGKLLECMGRDAIKLYDTFAWAAAVDAVDADVDRQIAAVVAKPAEDKYCLDTVFTKFDEQFGVHQFRAIKRQEFLDTTRGKMSIMKFIATLKDRAKYCDYGDKQDGFIVDMIINRVKDGKISERLIELNEDERTLNKAITICRQTELTSSHLKNIEKDGGEAAKVHHVEQRGRGRGRGRGGARGRGQESRGRGRGQDRYQGNQPYCDRCTGHHGYNECRAYNEYCGSCGQKGHFKKSPRCPNRSRGGGGGTEQWNRGTGTSGRGYRGNPGRGGHARGHGRQQNVHYADRQYDRQYDEASHEYYDYDYDYDSHDNVDNMFQQCNVRDVFTCNVDTEHSDADWTVTMVTQGKKLHLEIDSGARCNVLSVKTAQMLGVMRWLEKSNLIISGVSGKPMKVVGHVTLPCQYKDKHIDVNFQVIDTPKIVNLLGRGDCTKLGLIARVNAVQCQRSYDKIAHDYRDVLNDSIGCLPGEHAIRTDENVTPVQHPPRPVPAPIREQVEKELDHLEKCGIIKKVTEPTKWVSSMVCV